MDPAHENATNMPKSTRMESQTEKHDDEGDLLKLGNEPKIENEASSPSSSDTSSDEDFFQFDATEHSNSRPPLPQLGNKGSIAGAGSPELPISSPFSPDTCNGAKHSPPAQVMGRSDVPDPNRIPSSVFARTNTTTTPMEWSMASNESLFSIHMGNSSFSKDQVFLLGKSQELGNFSSSVLDGPPPSAPPTPSPPPTLSPPVEQPKEVPNAEPVNDAPREADKERTSAVAPRSTSTSRISDGSVCSFAFPILTGEGRDGSIKVGPEHQPPTQPQTQPQPQLEAETPKAVPAAAGNKSFPCFSCCSFSS